MSIGSSVVTTTSTTGRKGNSHIPLPFGAEGKILAGSSRLLSEDNVRTCLVNFVQFGKWWVPISSLRVDNRVVVNPAHYPDITKNYLRFRVIDPSQFRKDTFRVKTISQKYGIKATFGKLKSSDKMTLQEWMFESDSWTVDRARKWLVKRSKPGYRPASRRVAVHSFRFANLVPVIAIGVLIYYMRRK